MMIITTCILNGNADQSCKCNEAYCVQNMNQICGLTCKLKAHFQNMQG